MEDLRRVDLRTQISSYRSMNRNRGSNRDYLIHIREMNQGRSIKRSVLNKQFFEDDFNRFVSSDAERFLMIQNLEQRMGAGITPEVLDVDLFESIVQLLTSFRT